MAAVYQQFLASPSASVLADKAALHYLTTTTTIAGADDIIKHLEGLRKHLNKKKEEVVNAVEGQSSAAFEIDTALEFLLSGGPYLPGLDDNFITDRDVSLPVVSHSLSPQLCSSRPLQPSPRASVALPWFITLLC